MNWLKIVQLFFYDQYSCGFQGGYRWFTAAENRVAASPLSESCPPFARDNQPNLRKLASSVAGHFISNTGSRNHNAPLTVAIPD